MEYEHRLGYNHTHLVQRTEQHLFFTSHETEEAERQFADLGFTPGTPFVPVLGRDSSYLSHINEPTDTDSYRNTDITTFIPAMEYLADRFAVVRMGSVASQKLPTANQNILDYTFSGKRTELMDVYLSSHCHFFLTCSTGPDSIAMYSFRLPVLVVNLVPYDCVQNFEKRTLFMLKKYWHMAEERYLPLSEVLAKGIAEKYTPRELTPLGITVHDNTPEELREAAEEMVRRLDGTWEDSEKDQQLRAKFWELFHSRYDKSKCIAEVSTVYLRHNKELLK